MATLAPGVHQRQGFAQERALYSPWSSWAETRVLPVDADQGGLPLSYPASTRVVGMPRMGIDTGVFPLRTSRRAWAVWKSLKDSA